MLEKLGFRPLVEQMLTVNRRGARLTGRLPSVHPLRQGAVQILHGDMHETLGVHRDDDFGNGVVEQLVILSGVEVEQFLQRRSGKLASYQGDKRIRDRRFAEVALPEDCQDVLNT
jgi:hypothetical protein